MILVTGSNGRSDLDRVADAAAKAVEGERDVLVLVSVDRDDDVAAFERDAGHGC